MKELRKSCWCIVKTVFLSSAIVVSTAHGYYTTRGQDIVDRGTSEKVLLKGFGTLIKDRN